MRKIDRATPDQAGRLFELMVGAIEVGCASSYPPEIIAIWNEGRSVERQRHVIAEAEIYSIIDDGITRGFVHIGDSEIVGLFVHPDDHRRGYGTDLFRFAVDKIEKRPITIKSTLNAVGFYEKLGCSKVATELVRRNDHDIYIEKMEYF
jgi:ribosomal protein S18 acetylase RimI-like enzyme